MFAVPQCRPRYSDLAIFPLRTQAAIQLLRGSSRNRAYQCLQPPYHLDSRKEYEVAHARLQGQPTLQWAPEVKLTRQLISLID